MKKGKIFIWLMVAIVLLINTSTCKKDNSDSGIGTLHVIVKIGSNSYIANASVSLFNSPDDRSNGVIYMTRSTIDYGGSTDTGMYASFPNIPASVYYIKAIATISGTPYAGTETSASGVKVDNGKLTTVVVTMQ